VPGGKTGSKPSAFALNPASANSNTTSGQDSTNSDVTSATDDLESLISQLPSNLQDLYQGYMDTSVSNDKDQNTLLTDLDTLQDSVNTVLEQAQENPDQTIDPNSLDVPELMADDNDAGSTGSADTSTDGSVSGSTGSQASTGNTAGSVGGQTSSGTATGGGRAVSNGAAVGNSAALDSNKGLTAQRSSGLIPAHARQAAPGLRLNVHA
jgi:hypothetical protein